MKKIVILSALIFIAFNTNASAETFKVGLNEKGKEPISFQKDSKDKGIYVELLNAIAGITKDEFIYDYVPPKRIMLMFATGEHDIEMGINPKWRDEGVYSIPFAKAENVLVFAPGKKAQFNGIESLKGKKVGTVRGYKYPMLEEIERDDGENEYNVLTKLAAGRYDQAICVKETALFLIKNNKTFQGFEISEPVTSLDIMIRMHPSKKEALERFNNAITKLKQSGEIEKIYNKYR